MIPKTIHYCWFGAGKKTHLINKCIKSWKKNCPDYEIIEWNESNYNLSDCPIYVQQAYAAKKWAFVADFVRLDVVYQNGGIYLDTDVQAVRSLTPLLYNKAFFGFENDQYVNTGLGFGAERGNPLLSALMQDYYNLDFITESGEFNETPCPLLNLNTFLKFGLVQNGEEQMIDGNVHIYPASYFNPYDFFRCRLRIKRETVSIHWYNASWASAEHQKARVRARRDYLLHYPNRIAVSVFGLDKYERIKDLIKGCMCKQFKQHTKSEKDGTILLPHRNQD